LNRRKVVEVYGWLMREAGRRIRNVD